MKTVTVFFSSTPVACPVGTPRAPKISEGLSKEDYPAVAAKVLANAVPDVWCDTTGLCACRGCANRYLTWAEYECWHKYGPEFNRVAHPECLADNCRSRQKLARRK